MDWPTPGVCQCQAGVGKRTVAVTGTDFGRSERIGIVLTGARRGNRTRRRSGFARPKDALATPLGNERRDMAIYRNKSYVVTREGVEEGTRQAHAITRGRWPADEQ